MMPTVSRWCAIYGGKSLHASEIFPPMNLNVICDRGVVIMFIECLGDDVEDGIGRWVVCGG